MQNTQTRLEVFEELMTREIGRTGYYGPEPLKSRELRGARAMWTMRLRKKHGYSLVEITAAWNRAVEAAR